MPGATAMARIVPGDGVVNATLLASDGVTLKESTTALLLFTMGLFVSERAERQEPSEGTVGLG